MCSNNETTTSQYNKDLEISMNKYQVSSDVLRKLEDEGFNTEFLNPERQPTFDELVEELKTKGSLIGTHTGLGPRFELRLPSEDYYDWLQKLKEYALTSKMIDINLMNIVSDPWNNGYCGCGIHGICVIGININYDQHIDTQVKKIMNEIIDITKFGTYTLGRLNKTINDVETLNCDILAQGRELTDHRSTLDLISETVDNNAQDFIKHEQLYKLQFNELEGRVLNMETSSTTTTNTTTIEIQNIKHIINEHKTIIEVLSANIDNHSQTEDLLIFQHRQLNSIYLHLEERVSKMETIQKTDIQTMETYITKLNQRLAIMDKREEQTTEEVNSKMKHFEKQIKQLEDNVQDLNRYNQWVLLIATNLIIISYVVYKVIYIL